MKTSILIWTICLLPILHGLTADRPLNSSIEYADALRLVLALRATHVEFDEDGAVIGIAGQDDFTDQVMSVLHQFPRLKRLSIEATAVTSRGFKELARLPNLEQLTVADSSISNADLSHLTGLTKLTYVQITNAPSAKAGIVSQLTDEAINTLGKCKSLKTVVLLSTRISDSGFARLKALLPRATVGD